jgi:hypothetical protein
VYQGSYGDPGAFGLTLNKAGDLFAASPADEGMFFSGGYTVGSIRKLHVGIPITPPTISWPTAGAITYGQTLAFSTLTGGSAVSPITGASVPGTFAFTTPTAVPLAGMQSESITFTPNDMSEYSPVSSILSVLVNKAPTTVSILPAASAINYGQTLASSVLSGGAAVSTVTSAIVPGVFNFTNPTMALIASGPQSVTFTPTDTNDYLGATTSVTVAVTPVPIASISPASIDFGTLYLGSIVTKTVTITNVGDASMTISDPFIAIVGGGDSDEFVTVNLCPRSLAAGKSCIMTVTFIAGPFYNPQTATLKINDNAAGSPQIVALAATVIDPVPQFSPGILSFGKVKLLGGIAAKSITVTSVGGTALTISKINILGEDQADFSETDTCSSATLNPKATCFITVTFMPRAKGMRTAILAIADNAFISQQLVPLSGSGD